MNSIEAIAIINFSSLFITLFIFRVDSPLSIFSIIISFFTLFFFIFYYWKIMFEGLTCSLNREEYPLIKLESLTSDLRIDGVD
jgi:hypothetical protein